MGLRDHGIINYYMPLFAGSEVARLGRDRLEFPPEIYVPHLPEGTPVGGGPGGYDTPSDPTIATPTITFPSLEDHEGINDCGSILSSAFDSTNGQTHHASRWIVELIDEGGELTTIATGTIVYDVAAAGVNLASLPMEALNLLSDAAYRVRVRYQGSGGGWSDHSAPVAFTMESCRTWTCEEGPPGPPWRITNHDWGILESGFVYATADEAADAAAAAYAGVWGWGSRGDYYLGTATVTQASTGDIVQYDCRATVGGGLACLVQRIDYLTP